MNGLMRAITVIILASLVLAISCTKEYDTYDVSVDNHYFETLYRLQIGEVYLADTLQVGASTPFVSVAKGNYSFSAQTASNLLLKADLHLYGNQPSVQLLINEEGKLSKR